MYTMEEQFELQEQAMAALNRIRKNRIEEIAKPNVTAKPTYSMIFEEYDKSAFDEKLKYDMHIFEYVIESIGCEMDDNLIQSLKTLFETVNAIYEHINIKPEVYNNSTNSRIILESEEDYRNNAAQIVTNYMNKMYYDLTQEERDERYKNQVVNEAKNFILFEGYDTSKAVERAQKEVLYENLFRRVLFPLIVESNIQDMMTSKEYAEFFDQATLTQLWENFEVQLSEFCKNISDK